jgi:hypothetical protein
MKHETYLAENFLPDLKSPPTTSWYSERSNRLLEIELRKLKSDTFGQ